MGRENGVRVEFWGKKGECILGTGVIQKMVNDTDFQSPFLNNRERILENEIGFVIYNLQSNMLGDRIFDVTEESIRVIVSNNKTSFVARIEREDIGERFTLVIVNNLSDQILSCLD